MDKLPYEIIYSIIEFVPYKELYKFLFIHDHIDKYIRVNYKFALHYDLYNFYEKYKNAHYHEINLPEDDDGINEPCYLCNRSVNDFPDIMIKDFGNGGDYCFYCYYDDMEMMNDRCEKQLLWFYK